MQHLSAQKKTTIMIAILAVMLFSAINQTIVGTALPRIIAELGGMAYYSWVFTVYMLTSSITTILVGKLSDMYGRKPFILIGIAIFIVGSFLSGTSATIFHLIMYRGIQGFGAGMIMSTAFTAVGDLFAPRERGRWQGIMSSAFGLASVFGPTLGGYIVDHFQWHWVFWVFLPLGIIPLILIWVLFPSVTQRQTDPVDYWGAVFLTLFMVPLLLSFSWAGTQYPWASTQIIGLFAASLIALLLFVLIEHRAASPIIPLGLFRNSIFTISNLASLTLGAGMFGAIMYMPFFVQGVLGTSATHSGYVTMPMSLSLVAGSTVSGQIISRTGKYKLLAIAGLAVMALGMYLLSTMTAETATLTAILYMIVVGLGIGFGMPIFTLTVQNAVDQKLLGVATASSQLFRSTGGTIGVSIMGTVLAHRMADRMAQLSARSGADLSKIPPELAQNLAVLQNPQVLLDPAKLEQIRSSLPPQLHDFFAMMIAMLREALGYALSGVFLTGAIIVLLAVLLTFFLKEIPLRTGGKKAEPAR